MTNDLSVTLIMLGVLAFACTIYLHSIYASKQTSLFESWAFKKLKGKQLIKFLKIEQEPVKAEVKTDTAHCIVMALGDALEDTNKSAQFRKTQVVCERAKQYKEAVTSSPIEIPSMQRQAPPMLKVVK